jgi:DNA-directed RNA polymerase subunit M/transcription elongation factor TFIIS
MSVQSISKSPLTPFERPVCPKCNKRMVLTQVQAAKPDHDLRTFECRYCEHRESLLVQFR